MRAKSIVLFLLVVLALSAPVFATNPSFHSGNGCGTGGTTCNFTLAVTAGDLVLINCSDSLGSDPCTSVSDAVNTYTAVAGTPYTYHGNFQLLQATAATTATLTITCTWGSNAGWQGCQAEAISGTNLGIDKIATDVSTCSGTFVYSTGTTSPTFAPNELLVGFFMILQSGYTLTAGTGYTLRFTNNVVGFQQAVEDTTVSSTGSYQATLNSTNCQTAPTSMLIGVADTTAIVTPSSGFVANSTCPSNTTPCTMNTQPLTVTAGDTIIVVMSSNIVTHTFSIADSDSNSYSSVAAKWTNSNGGGMQAFKATAAHSTTLWPTCTADSAGDSYGCIAAVYANHGNSTTVDRIATNLTTGPQTCSGGGFTITAGPTSTTTMTNEIVLGLFIAINNSPWTGTAGSGYTARVGMQSAPSIFTFLEDKTVSSLGAQSASATITGASGCTPSAAVVTLGLSNGGGNRHRVISQ